MRKRPLCFLCIVLVVINFVFITAGDSIKSPAVFLSMEHKTDQVTILGEVYQCEYKENRQVIYLKQTVLSDVSVDRCNEREETKKERTKEEQTNEEQTSEEQTSEEQTELVKRTNEQTSKQNAGSEYTKEDNYIKWSRVKITCSLQERNYEPGDKVSVYGVLKEITPATNPGQFDSQAYYASKKIYFTMWEPEITLLQRPKIHMQRMLYRIRGYFSEVIETCVGNLTKIGFLNRANLFIDVSKYASIMQGIVLGEKSGISKDTTLLYQIGGISHILAISAMHLMLLGNGLYRILKWLGVPVRIAGVMAGAWLTVYGIFTGASVATLRALLMFLLNIGAQLTGRTYDGNTSLALAAVCLLAGNPLAITDGGFLLSFFAMLSFSLFREKGRIGSAVLLYLFMMPVTLWLFYELPLYSVCVNLIVVPTLAVVLISGVAVCILGGIFPFLGTVAAVFGVFLLYVYECICHLVQNLPYAKLILGQPAMEGICVYYGVLLGALWVFRKNRLSLNRFFVYLFMLPAIAALLYRPQKELQITALDVGQGDCLVVETPNHHSYLIDGGSSSVLEVGRYRILPYLQYKGIRVLDAVFLTHPDEDHISGILELLELMKGKMIYLQIERLVLPLWETMEPFEDIIRIAKELKVPVETMGIGDCLVDGSVRIECLSPQKKEYSRHLNEGSMVLQLVYRDFTGLFTGDLEGDCEKQVLSLVKDIDYLKVAHHGSKYSTSDSFLAVTQPEISIISCGKENRYGHPHKELLFRLQAASSDWYATKDYGAIWIRTDGEKIDLYTFCKYNETDGT